MTTTKSIHSIGVLFRASLQGQGIHMQQCQTSCSSHRLLSLSLRISHPCACRKCHTSSSRLLRSISCSCWQGSSLCSPEHHARKRFSARHVSYDQIFAWMRVFFVDSQLTWFTRVISCRNLLRRCFVTISWRSQLSQRILVLQRCSASLTVAFLTEQTVVLPNCATPPQSLLQFTD